MAALFEFDKINSVFGLISLGVTIATVIGMPRYSDRCSLWRTAYFGVTSLGIFFAAQPALMLGFWVLNILPNFAVRRAGKWQLQWRERPAFFWYQLVAMAAFLVATIVGQNDATSMLAGGLFLLAGLARQGIFPFHSFVPEFYRRAPWNAVLGYANAPVGIFILLRYALPHFAAEVSVYQNELTAALVAAAFYFVALASVQKNLRSVFAWITLAHVSLALLCMVRGGDVGEAGMFLHIASGWLALSGLGILIWSFEERAGANNFSDTGGMAQPMPVLAALFLVFGLAQAHIPASIGFISEDIIAHEVIEGSLVSALLVLSVTCLAAIAIYRAYLLTFLGEANQVVSSRDLRIRQRLVLGGLLMALLAGGLFPQYLINALQLF